MGLTWARCGRNARATVYHWRRSQSTVRAKIDACRAQWNAIASAYEASAPIFRLMTMVPTFTSALDVAIPLYQIGVSCSPVRLPRTFQLNAVSYIVGLRVANSSGILAQLQPKASRSS